MAEPLIVEVMRGDDVESVHEVSLVVTAADGTSMGSWGDAQRGVLPRSSVKPFQAIPLVESGAADALDVTQEELALASASHNGERRHVDAVAAWLRRIGLGPDDLECGVQRGRDDSPVANNCSGKHAGFLSVARHLGIDPVGYIQPAHEVQRLVTAAMASVFGTDLPGDPGTIDGCGIPVHHLSLQTLAEGAAGFCSEPPGTVASRITSAMRAHPFLVAGSERVDTELMEAVDDLIVKAGAEGVFVAASAGQWGLSLKCHDGATRAAEAALCWSLGRLGVDVPDSTGARVAHVTNWAGTRVGSVQVRPS